jgi:hypothetical protein
MVSAGTRLAPDMKVPGQRIGDFDAGAMIQPGTGTPQNASDGTYHR